MGALSVTGTEHYRTPFEPLIPGVKFAKYNDLDSVKALVSDKTCAIILEALQGEGGITPATDEFMKGLRQICDEEGILLICDEIQWYGTYRFYVCMAGIWCKTGHHDDGKSNWKWSSGRSICHDKRSGRIFS